MVGARVAARVAPNVVPGAALSIELGQHILRECLRVPCVKA
jgi:hypothetical protein